MLYRISRIIPVLFRSTYREGGPDGPRYRSVWLQWRGHVLWHRRRPAI